MAARTPRGTASLKALGTTLTIPSFTVPAGHSLVVCAGYDVTQGAPVSVVHAGRDLRRKVQRADVVNGIEGSGWVKGEYHRGQTGTCVLTWRAPIGRRAAFASSFDRVHLSRAQASALTALSTSPLTSLTAALQTASGHAVCAFVAAGPLEDVGGGESAEIENAGVFQAAAIGQTEGTNGAPAISNVTILEVELALSAANATSGRILNYATARNWVGLMVVLEEREQLNRQGVTISDIQAVQTIVAASGGNVDDILFAWDEDTGEYHAFLTGSPPVLVARYDITDGWVLI